MNDDDDEAALLKVEIIKLKSNLNRCRDQLKGKHPNRTREDIDETSVPYRLGELEKAVLRVKLATNEILLILKEKGVNK